MSKKIICYIQAFDCEKTIEGAMRSVLNQTYDNWLCFVLSNGNRNTVKVPNWSFDVIKNFAAKDKRFVVLNKKHNKLHIYTSMLYHLAQNFSNSYICSLDADDEYKSDFFERAVALAEEHGLDIVACGTDIVLKESDDAEEETLLSKREAHENLIISGDDLNKKFTVYKPFFNEMWGKLYDTNLFGKKYDERYAVRKFWWRFLPDTLFTIDTMSRCSAIGVLSGTSHKFYQFEKRSVNNATVVVNNVSAMHTSRLSIYYTYETMMDFLRSRGEISGELYEYMQAVLFGWFGDFYARTLLMTAHEKTLAGHAFRLVFNKGFDGVMRYKDSGRYDNLRNYEKRKEFCELLRNILICQEIIRNRGAKKEPITTRSRRTLPKIHKIIAKLDDTIQTLSQLQLETGAVNSA